MTDKRKKFELEANALQSVLEAIEHVQEAYDAERVKTGITKAKLADLVDRDPAYISRILNGRSSNVTLLTLARILLALDRWPVLSSEKLSDISARANYRFADIAPDDYPRAQSSAWRTYIKDSDSSTSDETSYLSKLRIKHVSN